MTCGTPRSGSTFQNNYWQIWGGYGPASDPGATTANPAQGVVLPSSLFSPVSTGSCWMPGYAGQGNLPGSLLQYSPYAVLSYLLNQKPDSGWEPTAGYPYWTGAADGDPVAFQPGSQQHVNRRNIAPFVVVTHDDFGLGGMTLKHEAGAALAENERVDLGPFGPADRHGVGGRRRPDGVRFPNQPEPRVDHRREELQLLPAGSGPEPDGHSEPQAEV